MERTFISVFQKQLVKNFFFILSALFLTAFFTESYALPFNITPNGALPTTVAKGSSVAASYLVSNNTLSQRNNNFVKYLPPNVSVEASGCQTNFNLAPKGKAGDTCVLNLLVKGAVNAKDTNPRNHLFVCFPGGKTCAGTLFPLNVSESGTPGPQRLLISISITPINATITVGVTTQQYSAIGTYSDGSTSDITSLVTWNSSNPQFATISQSGLATAVAGGTTIITAELGSITSNSATLTVLQFYAYITNFVAVNNVSFCPVNADGSFGSCSVTGSLNLPTGITINSAGTLAYIAFNGFGIGNTGGVVSCPIDPIDHSLGACTDAAVGSGLTGQFRGITLNPSNTIAYVTKFSPAPSAVYYCPINPNGTFGACNTTGNGITSATDIEINPQGTLAYVTQNIAVSATAVLVCTIDQTNGSFVPLSCVSANMNNIGSSSFGIALNNAGTFGYVVNRTGLNAALCPINQTTGSFDSSCTAALGILSFGLTLDNAGKFFYATNNGNTVTYCQINQQDGTLSACNTTGNGLSTPYGITIH